MNFVLASDDNFIPFLSITLVSLIENNNDDFEPLYIYIYILNDNISEDNKKHINSLVKYDNVYLEFIDTKKLDDMNFSLLGLERDLNVSLTTYARLFVASLLPDDIDKIIYLDCDALVLGSFKELWNTNLENNYIGAVLDTVSTPIKNALGFKVDENYINAGVLLINLKKWREDNVEQLFIKFMEDNQYKFYQHDQGIINNVFKHKIHIVDPKFNLAGFFNFLDYDLAKKFTPIKGEYYNKEIINNAINNPVFLHFNGILKPWFNENHFYKKTYEKYVELVGYDKNEIFKNVKFSFKIDLFLKFINNPLSKSLLKICPDFILYNQISRVKLSNFEKENEKARKLANSNS